MIMHLLQRIMHSRRPLLALTQWRAAMQQLYRAKASKLALTLLSLAFAAIVLAVLLYRDRQALTNFQWDMHWLPLGGALLCSVVCMVWAAYLWGSIMAAFGSRVTIAQHIRCYALSQLVKRLPGTIWYVASRGYLYQEYGEPLRLVTMASGLEFVLLFVSGACITLLLSIFALPNSYQYTQALLLVVLVIGILLIQPHTIRWLLLKLKMNETPTLRRSVIWGWLIAYLLLWFAGGVMYFWLLNGFVAVANVHLFYIVASWCLVGTLSFFVFFYLRISVLMRLA